MSQPEQFGTDTIADLYEARVVRHDVRDMYTKREVPQTALEADTWTPDASSPYPPVALLSLAALSAAGDAAGVGLYGAVALLAIAFLALSLAYFWRTRWYLFPLLYLNFSYLAERFFHVQDGSYLLMLTVVAAALLLARRAGPLADALMALAITIKLSPLFYVQRVRRMRPIAAAVFATVLVAGLVVPWFVLENYLYIYRFQQGLKGGDVFAQAGGLAIGALFAWLLVRIDRLDRFDREDWIGWSLVPAAVFFAFKMNVARHLLLVLLVPDKRGVRNLAAAGGLAAATLASPFAPLNSVLPMVTLALLGGLLWMQRTHRPPPGSSRQVPS
jgi:hypothetical protein